MKLIPLLSLSVCLTAGAMTNSFAQQTGLVSQTTPIAVPSLSTEAFAKLYANKQVKIIDFRNKEEFAAAFIPGTQFLGAAGPFKNFMAQVLPNKEQQFAVIVDAAQQENVLSFLQGAGYQQLLGVWNPDLQAWKAAGNPVASVTEITAKELLAQPAASQILDVRNPAEFEKGHVAEASNKPLNLLLQDASSLNPKESYRLYCQSGYRSLLVTSYLQGLGFTNIQNVQGGYLAISKAEQENK